MAQSIWFMGNSWQYSFICAQIIHLWYPRNQSCYPKVWTSNSIGSQSYLAVSVEDFESNGLVGLLGDISPVIFNGLFSKEELQIFFKKKCCVTSGIMTSKQQKERNQNIQVFVRVRWDEFFNLIVYWNFSAVHMWSIELTNGCWKVIIYMRCLVDMVI